MKISIMMLYDRLHWTLWILSCFGQYLCQDLQIPAANGTLGGSVVLAPVNPPSTPMLVILWQFGTKNIITVTSGVSAIDPAYEGRVSLDVKILALTLMNLSLDDSGTYRLTVTPPAGAAISGTTSLQVFERPSVRLIGPVELLIEGNSSANITSVGTGSITSVQWMKDNRPLSPSNSIIFSPDYKSVSISPVQRSDTGEYQCTYSNPVSNDTAKLNLTINYGPDDVSIEGLNVVDLGVSVSLSCSANSEPSASFSWTFNGTDTNVTTNTFIIDETDFTHSGDYDCTAFNNITKRIASQRHTLLVQVGGAGAEGLSTGAIVGIVIGVLAAVAGICGLIFYLIKNKKIPKPTLRKKGQGSGVPAQSREEPDMNYADVSHFQKASGERVILGNRNEPSTEYAEVKHGAKSKAPPRP